MRILFVSGTASGGAAISTHELADRIVARGHDVGMLLRPRRRNSTGLAQQHPLAPVRDVPVRLWRTVERALYRRAEGPEPSSHGPVWTARHLESVVARVLEAHEPDVVVVNSVHARAWSALHRAVRARGVPLVLYIREENAVLHALGSERPDLVLTNARSHADVLAARDVEAVLVPSIVESARVEVETSRRTVLFVNPLPNRGLDTAIGVARLRPDLAFVFQESHRLSADDRAALDARIAGVGNVTFRPFADRSEVYGDAKALLVPYGLDNRPRVVLEAQSSGIPVVAADRPGLDECVGDGGVLVPADAPPAAWAEALGDVVDDAVRYAGFVDAARRHARRDDVNPDVLAGRFEAAVSSVLPQRV